MSQLRLKPERLRRELLTLPFTEEVKMGIRGSNFRNRGAQRRWTKLARRIRRRLAILQAQHLMTLRKRARLERGRVMIDDYLTKEARRGQAATSTPDRAEIHVGGRTPDEAEDQGRDHQRAS